LLYPNVRNNIIGDIPIDVPANQNIGGDVSPASPAALTPVLAACRHIAYIIYYMYISLAKNVLVFKFIFVTL